MLYQIILHLIIAQSTPKVNSFTKLNYLDNTIYTLVLIKTLYLLRNDTFIDFK